MKILFINPILFTPTNKKIPKRKSIKDTIAYSFAQAFHEMGHSVTLITSKEYKPTNNEIYKFNVIFLSSFLKSIFPPSQIPLSLGIFFVLLRNRKDVDLVISSESFQICTLFARFILGNKLLIWQEMALHQSKFFSFPSLIWHNLIIKALMKNIPVAPRTPKSQQFISKYMNRVSIDVVPHGISADRFSSHVAKKNFFLCISRLESFKCIDKTITNFAFFNEKFPDYQLIIYGEGDQEKFLRILTDKLNMNKSIIFKGFQPYNIILEDLKYSKGLLVSTQKDNSLLNIPEAICSGTPIITTNVPDNAYMVANYNLGIAKDDWDHNDLEILINQNSTFVKNCLAYRNNLKMSHTAKTMLLVAKNFNIIQ